MGSNHTVADDWREGVLKLVIIIAFAIALFVEVR
jgi:hypothetical protein